MYSLDFDPEQFRAQDEGRIRPTNRKQLPRHKAGERFIKGPLPASWFTKAAKLPGRALNVALALWYLAGLAKRPQVKLTHSALNQFGVLSDAGRRGLASLESVGLVSVDRGPGRCPVVTILDGPPEDSYRELGSEGDMEVHAPKCNA